MAAIPATLALVGISSILSAVIGTIGGIIAAWRRNTWKDHSHHLGDDGVLLDARFLAGHDPPGHLCRRPGLVPRRRDHHRRIECDRAGSVWPTRLYHMFLPALTLTLAYLGEYTLVTRSSLLDVMGEDYLTVARAKGLRDVVVRNRHAVPNALLPVVTLTAINFGFVLSGAIAVEAVYSWPGLGKATADAIRGPDLPMLQALVPRVQRGGDRLQPHRRPHLQLARPEGGGDYEQSRHAASTGYRGQSVDAVPQLEGRDDRARGPAGVRPHGIGRAAARRCQRVEPGVCPCRRATRNGAPRAEFPPLGTDYIRRSVWAQFVWGSRVSLFVGLAATVLTILIGSVVGIVAGFVGGRLDAVLMRITEWFLVIPFLPLAIVLASVLGRNVWNIIFVIGITSWPSTARLVRAQVLTVKQRLFVDRARSLGASGSHIVNHHILPNVMGLILANATLAVPISILTETTLAFLGLGDPSAASWGKTLEEAFVNGAISRNAWWYFVPAGLGILVVVLAFTLIGRTLEEIANPRLSRGR